MLKLLVESNCQVTSSSDYYKWLVCVLFKIGKNLMLVILFNNEINYMKK